MFGYVEWTAESRTVLLRECRIAGMTFYCASIPRDARTPEFLQRLRCRKAAGKLQQMGVRRAAFPEAFPFSEEFACRGVFPIDTLPFYRAMAAELTAAAMREGNFSPASAVIAICADDLTPEVRRCVTELCIHCRYVTLSCCGGDRLRRELRREYGAVLVLSDDPEQLARTDVLVRFSARKDVKPQGSELQLYVGGKMPEADFRMTREQNPGSLPEGISRPQLFSALYTVGILRPGDVQIVRKSCGA